MLEVGKVELAKARVLKKTLKGCVKNGFLRE